MSHTCNSHMSHVNMFNENASKLNTCVVMRTLSRYYFVEAYIFKKKKQTRECAICSMNVKFIYARFFHHTAQMPSTMVNPLLSLSLTKSTFVVFTFPVMAAGSQALVIRTLAKWICLVSLYFHWICLHNCFWCNTSRVDYILFLKGTSWLTTYVKMPQITSQSSFRFNANLSLVLYILCRCFCCCFFFLFLFLLFVVVGVYIFRINTNRFLYFMKIAKL